MRLAQKYNVPSEVALLYEFLNSVDLRSYFEKGKQHVPSDELGTPARLEAWMSQRGLLTARQTISPAEHRLALELRTALRSFLQLPLDSRASSPEFSESLNRVAQFYPLVVKVVQMGKLRLLPASGISGLAQVLAELFAVAEGGRLDRLKMCSSDKCHWVFIDRSKPGNRRWCSSLLCGNRQKTRDYRDRIKNTSR
jgi:predicted RNA-binding Zn ribbon-like protein